MSRPALWLASLFLTALVTAAESPPRRLPPPTRAQIDKWVKELGDDSFEVRERATEELGKAGRAAEAALRAALKNPDREVVRRAKDLLQKFKWGIYPDTPKDVLELISLYRNGDVHSRHVAVRKLMDRGAAGHALVVKFLDAETNAETRTTLRQWVLQETPRLVASLVAGGKPESLEKMLEWGLDSGHEAARQHYVAYLVLSDRLGPAIKRWQARAAKKDPEAGEMLATLYRAQGDLARAQEAADRAGKKELAEFLLYLRSDWKELARRASADSFSTIRMAGYQAAWHRLGGDPKRYAKAIAQVRKMAEDNKIGWEDYATAASALLLNEESPREVVGWLRGRGEKLAWAFEFLFSQLEMRDAVALADKARADKYKDLPDLDLRRARVLFLLGERDEALRLFKQLADDLPRLGNSSRYEQLIETEVEVGLRELAFAHGAKLAAPMGERSKSDLLDKLFPGQGLTAEVWWDHLRGKARAEEPVRTMKRLRALLEGKVGGEEFTKLLRAAEKEFTTPPKAAAGGLPTAVVTLDIDPDVLASIRLLALADACAAANKKLPGASWKETAARYRRAWEKDRSRPLPLYLSGAALVRAGQTKEGRRLIEWAHWLPLGDEGSRNDFANDLRRRGYPADARREHELVVRTSNPKAWQVGNAVSWLSYQADQERRYADAAVLYERAMLNCLRTNAIYSDFTNYLDVPCRIHACRARVLLGENQVEAALQEARRSLDMLPGNVRVPILLVPELDRRGHKAEADKLLTRVRTALERALRNHPRSPMLHDSLARLLVRCRRQTGPALEHARKAVTAVPEFAPYLDTLAEVHFQRGDKAKARELIQKCVALEPRDEYYRRQLRRIEAGDPKAEVPPH